MSNLLFPSASLPGLLPKMPRALVSSGFTSTSLSRREYRVTYETYPRYEYSLSFELLRTGSHYKEFQRIFGFVQRHAGTWDSFLLQDIVDNAVTAHNFGVADGVATTFQLQRTLVDDLDLASDPTLRVYWPVAGDGYEPVFELAANPQIYVDTGAGPVLQTLGLDYTLPGLGAVAFTVAPAHLALMSWTGSYYYRVRFKESTVTAEQVVQAMWGLSSLPLITVKPKESFNNMATLFANPTSETPTGAFTGTTGSDGNATFSLAHVPAVGFPIALFHNGIRLRLGIHFTMVGATITILTPNIPVNTTLNPGESLVCDYWYL